MLGIDSSPTLIALAGEADPEGEYRVADASALPLSDGSASVVVAFMSLQDIEDAAGAAATVGRFAEDDETFAIGRSKFETFRQEFPLGRMSAASFHRPLEEYMRALEQSGFLVEALREIRRAAARRAGSRCSFTSAR